MDTAQILPPLTLSGHGRIRHIFGDYDRQVAHMVLDNNTLLHIHGPAGFNQVLQHFGSFAEAEGRSIQFSSDICGVLVRLQPDPTNLSA